MEVTGILELQCLGSLGSWAPLTLNIFVNPKVEIDGQRVNAKWGMNRFPLPPGRHFVDVAYPWIVQPRCNRATIEIDVEHQRNVLVRYRTNFLTFLPGRIAIIDQVALAKVHKR